MKFIDEAKIYIRAGHGGPGCVSFRREAHVPLGGPDGGHGGRGGSVIFKATHNMSTLLDFRYQKKQIAKNGENGKGSLCDGRAGEDLIVPVPVGTVILDSDNGDLIADLNEDGKEVVAAKGGRGGKGNSYFVNSVRQAPKFAQDGEEGEEKNIQLELKLLADVCLVGFPNAGKSTFISTVSKAKPKVANYPFTTLEPCLGVVKHKDAESFVIADLPGLIEGAHEGKGMGDQFLKHAERTKVILHLVSLSPIEVEDPLARYESIQKEVDLYYKKRHPDDADQRKVIVLLTQIDLLEKDDVALWVEQFKEIVKHPVYAVSSATRENVEIVLNHLIKWLKP